MTTKSKRASAVGAALCLCLSMRARGQTSPVGTPVAASTTTSGASVAASVAPAVPGYVIGPDDVLQIVFWRDKELSAEVVVRPDGRISLPLLNDINAAGSTPEQLRSTLVDLARQYVTEPNATVLVKEIRSRRVFITGSVEKPGPYSLNGPTTVLQLIALAGGLKEFADKKNIVVMRTSGGQQTSYAFDYHSVSRRMNLAQNITLEPGDTVIVR